MAQTEKKVKKKAEPAKPKAKAKEVDVSIESPELEELKKQLEEQKNTVLRTAAEFDNYKKRTEREKIAQIEFIKAETLKTFLPVLDNFGRALEAEAGSEEFKKGIELISKQLTDIMVKTGLEEIDDEGKEFNPELHQAILHIEDQNFGENIIVKTLQKGYKIGDTVIRPAMVQVAN